LLNETYVTMHGCTATYLSTVLNSIQLNHCF